MRIVIGEVFEQDGTYKMLRAVHIEIPSDCLELKPKDFAKQFLVGPASQLIAWRKEAIDHANRIIDAAVAH